MHHFAFSSFSHGWAAQAAAHYLLLWHTSRHRSALRWLPVISVMWISCFGRGFVKVFTFLWSFRCAADWLPTQKGTKNVFLTFLQPQLPLDSPNTLETMQTTNLLPPQLPVSISICRTSEFATSLGLFVCLFDLHLPSFCSVFVSYV